jgi:hypothetical protein
LKHSYILRDGIDQKLPAFADQTPSSQMQEKLMTAVRRSGAAQGGNSDPMNLTNTRPSLQRASILFVASVGSFIGASLLLASI